MKCGFDRCSAWLQWRRPVTKLTTIQLTCWYCSRMNDLYYRLIIPTVLYADPLYHLIELLHAIENICCIGFSVNGRLWPQQSSKLRFELSQAAACKKENRLAKRAAPLWPGFFLCIFIIYENKLKKRGRSRSKNTWTQFAHWPMHKPSWENLCPEIACGQLVRTYICTHISTQLNVGGKCWASKHWVFSFRSDFDRFAG